MSDRPFGTQERINAHILVVAGDRMASLLQWIVEEPDSGLVPEVLAAIRGAARADLTWWENCVKLNGFKSPAGPGGIYRVQVPEEEIGENSRGLDVD